MGAPVARLLRLPLLVTEVEIYHMRPGPDGLTRVTARITGEVGTRSWVVPTTDAEEAVLDEWAELHFLELGFPPAW